MSIGVQGHAVKIVSLLAVPELLQLECVGTRQLHGNAVFERVGHDNEVLHGRNARVETEAKRGVVDLSRQCSREQSGIFLPDHRIAFTGAALQPFAVKHANPSARVIDQARIL
jgi:hypothetical protein